MNDLSRLCDAYFLSSLNSRQKYAIEVEVEFG